MAGISSLFPDLPKQMSVMDRVKIIIQRHKNNYFKNWSTQELTFPQYLLQYLLQYYTQVKKKIF